MMPVHTGAAELRGQARAGWPYIRVITPAMTDNRPRYSCRPERHLKPSWYSSDDLILGKNNNF